MRDPNRLRLQSEGGFTIVELMVALVVLTVGLLPLFSVLGQGLSGIHRGGVQTVANQIAQDEVEKVRTMLYSDIGITGQNPPGTLTATNSVVKSGITYTVTRNVTWVDDAADGVGGADDNPKDYKDFEVKVSWSSPKPAGDITLGTFVKPYTPQNHPPIVHAPVVTPSYPLGEGGYIKENVTLMAQASDDDGTIAEVQFLYRPDGGTSWTTIGSTTTKVGDYYQFSWNTSGLSGTYQVMAKAWDNVGLVDSTYAGVVIDNTYPTATIYPPAGPVTSSGVIAIAGNAYDVPSTSFSSFYIQHDSATSPAVWQYINCSYSGHPGITHSTPTVTGITNDLLEYWNVSSFSDGTYTLRLTVNDKVDHSTITNQTIIIAVPPPTPVLTGAFSGSNVNLSWDSDTLDGPHYSFTATYKSIPAPSTDFYTFFLLKPSGGSWIDSYDLPAPFSNTSVSMLHKYPGYKIRAQDSRGNYSDSNVWPP